MQLNISKYIGIFHLFGMIIKNIYGFIIPKYSFFDKLYLISFVLIPFSWVLCKDECIISYLIKKYKDTDYILGNEPENITDMTDLFVNKYVYYIFYNTNHLLSIGSLVMVNDRTTKISYLIFTPTFILYSFYVYDISYKLNYRKKMYPYFQMILCMYLFVMFYKVIY